jgi:hypothetical protein
MWPRRSTPAESIVLEGFSGAPIAALRHHPAPFLRLAGGERQPGQIFQEQFAAFGRDQAITEERKTGPRAGQVNTVVRVELNHAAISSLAGVEGAGKSRARGPAIAMRNKASDRRDAISHNVYYVQAAGVAGTALAVSRPYSGMEPDRA